LEIFRLERFVKSNRLNIESHALSTSGAKGHFCKNALIAALKRCATPKHFFIASFDVRSVPLLSQDKDADKTVVPAPSGKKNQKKDQKKEAPDSEKKDEEKKGGMTADTFSGLKFRSIGPAVASGRVMSIAVNPKDKFEYYVGVASGGVWKTVNDGTTWTPVFDKEASYSIGWVTLDPNDAAVVWVGTGESNSQRSVAYGDGIYRSDDGGKNWQNLGLKKSEHIGRVVIDPRDSKVVYVAAEGPLWGPGGDRGLYKTTDGGKNWKAVLTISENTGVVDVRWIRRIRTLFMRRLTSGGGMFLL
jgi:hypothetical protein